ncbi:hypothetical protein D1AOALGA4SA_2371 [Olavius algarvensis Delta 1 endosymbiont]|nr:hypothetical protein D1AOALGA4SA_2371 [Olavius algarvensis Delta 1 endosymbiont]
MFFARQRTVLRSAALAGYHFFNRGFFRRDAGETALGFQVYLEHGPGGLIYSS